MQDAPPERPLRAVLFDLWNTLISDAPNQEGPRTRLRLGDVRAVLHESGVQIEPEVLHQAMRATTAELSELHDRSLDISADDQVRLFLARLGRPLGDVVTEATFQRVAEAYTGAILKVPPRVEEGAVELLAELKQHGVLLGLVSNTGTTPGSALREILRGEGLLDFFDTLCFSDEVHQCKPAPEMYLRTLAALATEPAAAVFVGDMPVLDVDGPQRAGLGAVLIGAREQDDIRPEARIARLGELPGVLRALGYRYPR